MRPSWNSLAFPGSVSGVYSGYWWIPIVGPLIGAVAGIVVYDLFIGDVLLLRAETAEPREPGRATPVRTTDDEE